MLRPPRRPTLFPYTTLFRSAAPPEGFNYELFLDEKGQKISKSKGNGLTIDFEIFWPFSSRDRKSTRLNSSHTVISYAVFCLKKKNTNRDATHLLVLSTCDRS